MNLSYNKMLITFVGLILLQIITASVSTNISTSVKLFVEGNGFHRNFKYQIETNFNHPNCHIALHLKLPSSLYVNVDELEELRRSKQELICSEGEKDVESFSEKALPQKVTTCSVIKDVSVFSVPIHQRYQYASTEGGYKNVTFPKPILFLSCPEVKMDLKLYKNELCSPCNELGKSWQFLPYKYENKTYIWQVPVGQKSMSKLVVFITLLTTFVGSVFILKTAWKMNFVEVKEE